MSRQELLTGIRPGDRVRDVLTGTEGIVTGVAMHMTGCDTVGIQQRRDKDDKLPDPFWCDANRLTVIERDVVKLPGLPAPEVRRERQGRGAMGNPTSTRSNPA